ncbi:hypothetical protein GCM10010842_29060 [Deinococcus daejeonensis]|uniref:Copper-sensing transcriptional repressor CsoR n=2 Tax=Deinococcus daejeonensis TaxID=1007098 RepID=A0ABQ2JAD8_9DEIO|nr:hypothetical protein GCM10010842_29060 [Deinococcus daejeonensis]
MTPTRPAEVTDPEGQGHMDPLHLCMPGDTRKQAARRLAIARGHLDSIRRALQDPDVYCLDILQQLKAVQGALNGVANVVLRGHLQAHVTTAAARGDAADLVDELMDVLTAR